MIVHVRGAVCDTDLDSRGFNDAMTLKLARLKLTGELELLWQFAAN
jgi:hypothetical protein